MKTLNELLRLKARWQKARAKDSTRKERALKTIDNIITSRTGAPVRYTLPKKKQRQLGILPPLPA